MKKIYRTLAFSIVSLSLLAACGSPTEEVPEVIEPLTEADFEVLTASPEIGDSRVTLKGRFEVDEKKVNQELVWGFFWFTENEDRSQMKRITVGRGFASTAYQFHVDDFPTNVQLTICAFVEARLAGESEPVPVMGEEVTFGF